MVSPIPWTSPRTWVAGEVLTAALLNTHLRDNLKTLGDAWTAYTSTWTGTVTNPVIGNGTNTGAYLQSGKLVVFRVHLVMGSTTTYGSGDWQLTLPVAPVSQRNLFDVSYFDTSAGGYIAGGSGVSVAGSTTMLLLTPGVTAGGYDRTVTSAIPFAWATGDTVSVSGVYEAA